jgi:hypothetical protein
VPGTSPFGWLIAGGCEWLAAPRIPRDRRTHGETHLIMESRGEDHLIMEPRGETHLIMEPSGEAHLIMEPRG